MKNLLKAIATFQQECPPIEKKTKGYGYNYADLPTILETINPILKKNKLGFTQLVNGDGENVNVKTILFETETGESIETISVAKIENFKGMTNIQGQGSIITYLRRYSLSAILGIVTEDDSDGAIKQENKDATKANPEKWLNIYTSKYKKAYTKEFINAHDAIHNKGKTITDIREVYKVSNDTAKMLELEILTELKQ